MHAWAQTLRACGSPVKLPPLSIEACIGEGSPIGDGLFEGRYDAAIGRFTLAEGEFEAEFIVGAAAFTDCAEQFLRRDAAILVVVRREWPVAALVHARLFDVDDGR